jgi:uncharacterized protein (TIGR03435 family)
MSVIFRTAADEPIRVHRLLQRHGVHLRRRTLITIAYRSEGIQRFDQLIGAPAWLSVDRFDIAAKPGAGSDTQIGPSALPTMLRSLLRERFRLRVHTDTHQLPAYALVPGE